MPINVDNAWQWLLSPISGASTHHLNVWVVWHARLMVLAWAVLLPLGVLAARYYKITPQQNWPLTVDSRAWWNAHRALQYSGVLLMLVGVALVWNVNTSSTLVALVHAYFGWAVASLGVFQVLGGLLRGSKGGPTDSQMRGDHYDMTPHRLWFERLHKSCGWLAVVAAVVTVILGLLAADAPRWMPVVLGTWWLLLVGAGLYLERAGRCVDTYQAIWGPDPQHPGNQRTHFGWGMRHPQHYKDRA